MRERAVGSGCAGARLLRLRWCTAAPTRGWWDHSLDRNRSLRDRYHSLQDRNHSLRDRYHSLRDRNRSLRDRYHSLQDRSVLAWDRSRDRSVLAWDRYHSLQDRSVLAWDRSRDRSKVRKPLQTRTWDRWDRYFGYHPNNI